MPKYIKIILSVLLVISSLLCLYSCADKNDTTYTIDGLTFTIPTNMRRSEEEKYDIYFSTYTTAFIAMKIDEEFLTKEKLPEDTDAKAYVDILFDLNDIDKEQCEVSYSESQKAYKFHFSNSPDNVDYTFNYCVVLDGVDCVWYVVMMCNYEDASGYLPTFEIWGNSIRAK